MFFFLHPNLSISTVSRAEVMTLHSHRTYCAFLCQSYLTKIPQGACDRLAKIQSLKSRMRYLARFLMLTLLLDELQRKESYSMCIYPSINQYPCPIRAHLVYDICSFFDALKTLLFCVVGRSSYGKFLETTSHHKQVSKESKQAKYFKAKYFKVFLKQAKYFK